MADILNRLTDMATFTVLQDKIQQWSEEYHLNTCDENISQGSKIVELNARIQEQLCQILFLCANEGGLYRRSSAVKCHLYPLLSPEMFGVGCNLANSLELLDDISVSHREISDLRRNYQKSLDQLEMDIKDKMDENKELKQELEQSREELDRQNRASASEKMFAETEMQDLETKELTELQGRKNGVNILQSVDLDFQEM